MSTSTTKRRRPAYLPPNRVTLTEAYADILRMPKSTFMATYRNGADPKGFAHWAKTLDIRETRKDAKDGKGERVVCVHCDRARVESLRDELAAAACGGHLSLERSELAGRLGPFAETGGGRRLLNERLALTAAS